MQISKLIFIILPLMIMVGQANSATSSKTNSPKKCAAKICCLLFGDQNASDDIVKQVEQARDHFTISKDDRLPVKYINSFPLFKTFSSFTWFGSWFNKEEWGQLNDNEKSFAVYHEVVHEKLNHPIKQIGVMLGTIATSSLLGYVCPQLLKNKFLNFGLKTILGSLVVVATQSWYAQTCEQEADIHAAQKLCELGKKDVVTGYLDELNKNNSENCYSIWFPPLAKQQEALQSVLEQHQT